ncbi:hypothetical protein [Mucilaginibacter endophyticus]|uniref:hypothetical protein n=1 Tax=Mucilaginibacter endophyticus TaxID=2675003 RepID=UPI000E0D4CFF|nr:hypothetical protein [Mucilaginibacter endophyticus]
MRKALITLAIGEKFEQLFNEYCRANWQQYCDLFDFELIVITNALDKSELANTRSPSWQKLLILSQPWSLEYDRIVWVDSDVVINCEYASDITQGVPLDKVGCVDQYSMPTPDIFKLSLERLYKSWDKNNIKYLSNLSAGSYYSNRGIPGDDLNHVIQAGIFVCSPKFHKEIFEKVYYQYDDKSGGGNYENPALSYELLRANLVFWLPCRFNFCVINIISAFYPHILHERKSVFFEFYSRVVRKLTGKHAEQKASKEKIDCLKNIYDLSIFMHFASCSELMPKMKEALILS